MNTLFGDNFVGRCEKAKDYLEFSVDVANMKKGTGCVANTQDIADYVRENYGLYAHTMQIAMVRAKLGIAGHGQHLNKKPTKTKPMPLPEDKEIAITEALRYYGYIK